MNSLSFCSEMSSAPGTGGLEGLQSTAWPPAARLAVAGWAMTELVAVVSDVLAFRLV
jgi:hypothetical protein